MLLSALLLSDKTKPPMQLGVLPLAACSPAAWLVPPGQIARGNHPALKQKSDDLF
jgi:hypothetical protein